MKIYYLCTLKYTDMKKNLLNIQKLLGEKELEELRTYSLTVWHPSPTNGYTEYDNIAINNNSYIYLLVEQGEAQVMINYKLYHLVKNSFIVISPIHVLQLVTVGENFCMTVLLVRKSILEVTPSMEKVFKQLNRSLKLYINPVLHLNDDESRVLHHNIEHIQKRIGQKEHHLQTETIQNAFIAFLLDWIHIGDCHFALTPSSVDLNRSEQILQSFVKLLKTHYKEEHETAFYASRLSLTSHHLNWVIKRLTGHTVSELIYDLLYCEACILLNQSNHSIEEITDELHFSDASAFCKFFKRRTSITPLQYRKGL